MFSTPSLLTLESQPIGRGTVQLLKGEYGRGLDSVAGLYFTRFSARCVGDHYDTSIVRRIYGIYQEYARIYLLI